MSFQLGQKELHVLVLVTTDNNQANTVAVRVREELVTYEAEAVRVGCVAGFDCVWVVKGIASK